MSLDDLYQEVILDHFRKPRCQGCLSAPDAAATLFNPLCGDQINLTVKSADNSIQAIAFAGHGCSISQASASMMAHLCQGKTLDEGRALIASFKQMMRGEKQGDDLPELGDAAALQGVRRFSAKAKCAMLCCEALEKCITSLAVEKSPEK